MRADSLAKNSGVFLAEEIECYASAAARLIRAPNFPQVFAMHETFMRASGCECSAKVPSRSDDQNVSQFVSVARAYFLNSWIVGTRGFVGTHDQFDFGADFGIY